MRVLIAEDDPVSRMVLESTLRKWGFDVVSTRDGGEAWEVLASPDRPSLAILDWMMPEIEGVELCRRARSLPGLDSLYVIMLTAKARRDDLVLALDAGADDYLVKPFDRDELRARIHVGVRVVELQRTLAGRVRELQEALDTVKRLGKLLPICCYCKKIRDDQNYWLQVEEYLGEHSDAEFTHGICPDCLTTILDE